MPRWTPFEPYFWSLVVKSDGCWMWLGGKDGKGYGRIWRDGRRQGAHRVSYELAVGQIPDGLFVCHHCDVKLCVNPDHFFIGTAHDNVKDCTVKGRNPLINDRSLWSMGRHFSDPEIRRRASETMLDQYRSGKRQTVRLANGRYGGSRTRG